MRIFPVHFDADTWIAVPLRYPDRHGATPAEWAEWAAGELTRGRPLAAEQAIEIAPLARAVAEFDSSGVAARLWHYPIDGRPGGWVDIAAERVAPGASAASLIPEPRGAIVDPVTVDVAIEPFDSVLRRLSLRTVGGIDPTVDGDAGVLASAEWVAVRDDWAVLALSDDADPAALSARVDDIEAVLAGVEPWSHQDELE